MFIRKVPHKNRKNRKEYYTYKLVESIRTGRGPRQRDILNIGVDFDLPKEQWKDLNEQQIWDIYTMLTDIEDAFRCMKSELGLRPIYHQKEVRCDGHIFITLLAYHLLHTIRYKLRQRGVSSCWTTIRKQLSTQVMITTTMKRKDGKIIRIRKSSKAELSHQVIYDALNLPYQPGETVKTIL